MTDVFSFELGDVDYLALNGLARVLYGYDPSRSDLNYLINTHWDDTIDGSPYNVVHLGDFFGPFFNTHKLQNQ